MYQFIHVESYSRSTPKRASTANQKTGKASSKASGHCVKYVLDEARREADSVPHVDAPMPPTYVFGEPLEGLEAACDDWANSLRDARGHATRKDALCLLAGVVSAPKDITPEAWDAFQSDSAEWLKAKYGAALRTVIAHHDESHPHLHFYVIPEAGQRFETVHQGRAAAALVKAENGVKGLQNQAYKQAMREYQDEFYDAVGIEHGFTRIGPAKRRLTREEWKLEQIQAAAAARAIEVAKESVELSAAQGAALIADAKAEATTLSAAALKNADRIEREAEKKGWQAALDKFEQLPWFKRVLTALGRDSEQRAAMAKKISKLEKRLEVQKKTMGERITELFDAGKAFRDSFREMEPELAAKKAELKTVREELKRTRVKADRSDDLAEALATEKGRNQHLAALNEALQPKVQSVMHVPGDKKKKFDMPDFESPSV